MTLAAAGENRRGKSQRAADAGGGTKEGGSLDQGARDDVKDAQGTMSPGLGDPLDSGVREKVTGSQWVGWWETARSRAC